MKVEVSTILKGPPDQVFALVSQWDLFADKVDPDVKSITRVTDGPVGVGTSPHPRIRAVDFHTGLCYRLSNITSTTLLITTLLVAVLIGREGRQTARLNPVYERLLARVPLSGPRSR